MEIVKVTQENFEDEVLKSEKPVLLDFFANWCGPCKMISPIIHEIAEEYPDYKVCKVDVDEEGALATRYNIISIPTLVVIKNGEAVHVSVGFKQKEEILKMLED